MRKRLVNCFMLMAMLLPLVIGVSPAMGATGDPLINEFVFNHAGTDTHEYIEIFGDPNTDYSAYWILQLEGDSTGAGVIDGVWQVGTTEANGFWATPYLNDELENGTVTLLLVENFTGSVDNDLDTDNDGALDTMPWDGIVDDVAVHDGGSSDHAYAAVVLTQGYDGNSFTVGGASRIPNGTDTDVAADWVRNDFDGEGLPGFTGTPEVGEALNTPGLTNESITAPPPPPPPEVTIYDIQFTTDPSGDSPYDGQTVTTQGVVTAFFYDGGNRYTFIQDGTGPWSGLLLYKPNGFVNVGDLLEVTGGVSEYYGLTEIAYGDATVLSSSNPLPAPEVLASGDVSQEQWESVLVRVENVTVTDDDLGYGEWLVDDGSGGVRVDDLGGYSYVPNNGDLLDFVQGPLFYSHDDFKIEPRDDGDISVALTICEIQGSGLASPYEGQTVRTQGVVFADFDERGVRGFFIQDEDCDGDPATSDGIFVYKGNTTNVVSAGDLVEVRGTVQEYYELTEIGTSLSNITVLSSGNPLPAPVPLIDLPNESIAEGIAFWEPLEGMLVSVQNGFVVAPTSPYGEFGMLTETDADADLESGYFAQTKQSLIRSLGDGEVDYNPERILVDDSSLDHAIVVMPGDRVRSLVGAVDYTFGNYKLQPISYDVKTHRLPSLPASTRSGRRGDTVITTFNVENLFDLVDNPDKDDEGSTPTATQLQTQLTKLALAIQVELELPEILVVQEVENTEILQELGNRVNMAAGTAYMATSFETSDVRGIEVGFLWDANRVELLDAYQMSGLDVEAAFGPSSPSPGREPLVGVFEIGGRQITIIGNHFKSKSGDDALFGMNQPPGRITEVQRKMQAGVVRDFVDTILDGDPDAIVMVAGDLNDFQFGEPGEGTDHPVAILEGVLGGLPLINLVNLEKAAETYTYVYDGNSQVLDHMLVSPALYDLFVAVDILHFNASYPDALGDDPSTPLGSSDHDPLEGRFRFR